jgi:hypothetical protein
MTGQFTLMTYQSFRFIFWAGNCLAVYTCAETTDGYSKDFGGS